MNDQSALTAGLDRLRAASALPPEMIEAFRTFIEKADDYDLFRINPIQYAHQQAIDEDQAITLFLYAARAGLVEMRWNLVCALCAHIAANPDTLREVHAEFVCPFCGAENNIALDDLIQVTFTVLPQVRTIAYHDPTGLPIEHYYLRYHFAKGTLPYGGQFTLKELGALLSRFMGYVEPGETRAVDLDLPPGTLLVKDLHHRASLALFMGEGDAEQMLPVSLVDSELQADTIPIGPVRVEQPLAPFHYPQAGQAESGRYHVSFTNRMTDRSPLWILHYPAGFERHRVNFEPFLSGKRLVTNRTFRDLFRDQTLAEDENVQIQDVTVLFTDLTGSTAMYDRVGDPQAFFLVRQHFEVLLEAVGHHHGSIVKTIGDAVMAAFGDPLDAVQAAVRMAGRLAELNRTISEELTLKIGIHRGHAIAVTLNDRLDFFGQAVNIAARIQALATGSRLVLTMPVASAPGVQEALAGLEQTQDTVTLKGVSGSMEVTFIRLDRNEGANDPT
jgi:class 3 adenylate cyclase